MSYIKSKFKTILVVFVMLSALTRHAQADNTFAAADSLLIELGVPTASVLEKLIQEVNAFEAKIGLASYYAKRFEGKKTTSGQRYHPEKMTAAHHSLPLGTVVRVVNTFNRLEVFVTINDRCAKKKFPFIDLSRAAAKKIGLWGKGTTKVVIIPLPEENIVDTAS